MGRLVTGTVQQSRGKFYAKVTVAPKKRRAFLMPWCKSEVDAEARLAIVVDIVQRLRSARRPESVESLAEQAAAAPTKRELAGVLRVVELAIDGDEMREQYEGITFEKFAERVTDGTLHREFPDHVKDRDYEAGGDLSRLRTWVLPIVKDIPIAMFKLEHGEAVMRQPDLPKGSRRHVAQVMVHILNLAVYPAKIITVSPFPRGWLPKPSGKKAGAFLYPEEDAQLLAHTAIPVIDRLLFGFLAREGTRSSEAAALTWADIDTERGTVNLDENKTDEPRSWVLDPGVLAALKWWRAQNPTDVHVFEVPGRGEQKGTRGPINVRHLAAELRTALLRAKVRRADLFERSEKRMRMRAHGLRATFVTLSLANGKTETWVCDRTGHKSSTMIARYRQRARFAAELNLGALRPLNEALPETSANVSGTSGQVPESGPMNESPENQGCDGRESNPHAYSALEPKTTRGNRGARGAPDSADATSALASVALLENGADVSRTFARRPRTRAGRAADLAVRAALTGDPAVIGPAMRLLAAAVKCSPIRQRVAS